MDEIQKLTRDIALPPIELWAPSLFKFGFRDGDLIQYWVNDVYDNHRIWLWDPLREVAGVTGGLQRRLWSPNWHAALWELARTRLLPLLPGTFDLQLSLNDNSHNPTRIETWNGTEFCTRDDEPAELTDIGAAVEGHAVLDALVTVSTPGYEYLRGTSRIVWS